MPKRKLLRPSILATRCPFCEGTLKPGAIEMDETFWRLLGSEILKFRGTDEEREILDPSEARESYLCTNCGTLITPGPGVRLPRTPL